MLPVGPPPLEGSRPVKLTPGAARFGSSRSPLSVAGSAPLEKPAITSPDHALVFMSSNAPTLTTFHAVAGACGRAALMDAGEIVVVLGVGVRRVLLEQRVTALDDADVGARRRERVGAGDALREHLGGRSRGLDDVLRLLRPDAGEVGRLDPGVAGQPADRAAPNRGEDCRTVL